MNCPACGSQLRAVDGLCPTCVARTMTSLLTPRAPADTPVPAVAGYEIGAMIGRGGMGFVYRGIRASNGEAVAIKVMSPEFSDNEDLAERFAREVEALHTLDHPHILRVLDSGLTSDDRWFLITELAARDLSQLLRDGRLPEDQALRIFRQVVSAIGEAHRHGIAHRDIKPANILLTAEGSVRVADFSLAKLLDAGPDLTRSMEVFGTPYYIAPEVRQGAAHVTERADVFSLGILLHELLTGRLPIGKFEPAPRFAPLIARCLQEDPDRRPASAEQLLAELERKPRTLMISFTLFLILTLGAVAAGLIHFKRRTSPTALVTSPAAASLQHPWENSLGMKFVPVPGTRVLFCTWETRERDFEVFADSNQHPQFGINAQWHNTHNGAGSDHPVEPVSMLMAEQFCEWLTRRELTAGTLPTQMSYRLPSDEEWSRAALLPTERGATPKERHNGFGDEGHAPYVWGRTWFPPSVIEANYAGQESIGQQSSALRQRDAYPGTAPVGSFKPNPLGLYDLAGNVSEWCATSWDVGSSLTVIRGGAWIHSKPSDLRLDSRQACNPGTAPLGAGFRIVLDPGVQP